MNPFRALRWSANALAVVAAILFVVTIIKVYDYGWNDLTAFNVALVPFLFAWAVFARLMAKMRDKS